MSPDFKVTVTESGLQVSAELPGRCDSDFEITFEGSILRVVGKQRDHAAAFESVIDLLPGFDQLNARATYLNGKLRIVLPKV